MTKEAYELGQIAAMVDVGLLPVEDFEKRAYNVFWNPVWEQEEPGRAYAANVAAGLLGGSAGIGSGLALR